MSKLYKKNFIEIVNSKNKKIKKIKKIEELLKFSKDYHLFINRFRNCDYEFYHDRTVSSTIKGTKIREFKKKKIENSIFKLAYVIENPNDTGSASIIKRFILSDSYYNQFRIKNYILILTNNISEFKKSGNYLYLKTKLKVNTIKIINTSKLNFSQQSSIIEKFLIENKINFLFSNPSPVLMDSIKNKPVDVTGFLTQDCHVFNIGYNIGDLNFYVLSEQIYKYHKFDDKKDYQKILLEMPLPDKSEIFTAKKFRFDFLKNIKNNKKVVISASTNMWKHFMGDSEEFLDCLKELIKQNKNYHHVFVGTSRSIEFLEMYLNKNPEIKDNIHYVGVIRNIYSLFKSINFYINSFPVSGGSTIEATYFGIPSIDVIHSRDLTLHPIFFYKNNFLTATSRRDFLEIASKLIVKKIDKRSITPFQNFIKENLNKERIIKEKLYFSFIDFYLKKKKKEFNFANDINYERSIVFFEKIIKKKSKREQISFLKKLISKFPTKLFGFLRLIQISILSNNFTYFKSLIKKLPDELKKEVRIDISIKSGQFLNNKNFVFTRYDSNFLDIKKKYFQFYIALQKNKKIQVKKNLQKLFQEDYY